MNQGASMIDSHPAAYEPDDIRSQSATEEQTSSFRNLSITARRKEKAEMAEKIKEQEQFEITIDGRWITHNYVLHSMPADFELGVADVGVALAAATAASSGHWMDQILKTHCSLLIYESVFEETTHCNPYSPLPVAVMAQVEATHQLATQLEATFTATTAAASTSRKKLSVSVKSILNRLDRGRNSSLSEMQVETELSPGECIGWQIVPLVNFYSPATSSKYDSVILICSSKFLDSLTTVKPQFLTCIEAVLPVIMTFAFNVAGSYVMATFRETRKKLSFKDSGLDYLQGDGPIILLS
ncbi:hypothetical protein Tco_0798240 [Tanacetum coccineum]